MAGQLLYFAGRFDTKSLNRWFELLTPSPRQYAKSWTEAERIRELSNMVVYGLPHMKMGNCMKLSILRYIHLRKRGFNVRFHMGIKPTSRDITGHAWLSLNDELLWEDPDFIRDFRETFSYPGVETFDRHVPAPRSGKLKLLAWRKSA